jgi:hypothetical protein
MYARGMSERGIKGHLEEIYTIATEASGRAVLEEFGRTWNEKYFLIYQS